MQGLPTAAVAPPPRRRFVRCAVEQRVATPHVGDQRVQAAHSVRHTKPSADPTPEARTRRGSPTAAVTSSRTGKSLRRNSWDSDKRAGRDTVSPHHQGDSQRRVGSSGVAKDVIPAFLRLLILAVVRLTLVQTILCRAVFQPVLHRRGGLARGVGLLREVAANVGESCPWGVTRIPEDVHDVGTERNRQELAAQVPRMSPMMS